MKLAFAGTPPFAAVALEALLEAGHRIALVLTQPDRPAGRGLKAQAPAVKTLAERRGLTCMQPNSLKEPAATTALRESQPDALIVAAYGLLLPPQVLTIPRLGSINIHASLLPRWRGAAPIQRALLAGDAETGITIMQMDEGLDTGAILLQKAIPITADETAKTLHDKLADLGAELIVRTLDNPPPPRPQDPVAATYAAKIDRREARLDWEDSAQLNARKVRAFNPVPGAHSQFGGAVLKVWRAEIVEAAAGAPGAVLEAGRDGIVVACGEGGLRLLELQRAGGRRLSAAAFLAGAPLAPGARLGT